MKLEIHVAEIHVHIHHVIDAPELVDVIVEAAKEVKSGLNLIAQEIKQMANDLSTELAGLNQAAADNAAATAALAPAIEKELQQVAEAIASGSGAAQALESARSNITTVTQQLQQNAQSLQSAVAALGSDDAPVAETPTEPAPAESSVVSLEV